MDFSDDFYEPVDSGYLLEHLLFVLWGSEGNFLPIMNDLLIKRRNLSVEVEEFYVIVTFNQLCTT